MLQHINPFLNDNIRKVITHLQCPIFYFYLISTSARKVKV